MIHYKGMHNDYLNPYTRFSVKRFPECIVICGSVAECFNQQVMGSNPGCFTVECTLANSFPYMCLCYQPMDGDALQLGR